MTAGGKLARGFGGAGRKLRRAEALREKAEECGTERHHNHRRSGEEQHEHQQSPSAEAADRFDVGRRSDGGDHERNDERDHGHANRVDPERPDRRDGVGGMDESIVVRCGDGDTGGDGDAEGDENARAFFHVGDHIIRSPPLMSNDAPVMYPASSDAAKQIKSATSSGVPRRGTG